MEDYIVRIYRRKEEDGGLFGVVEEVGGEERKAFRSMTELVRLLQGDPLEERRKEERIRLAIPATVEGKDVFGSPFSEETVIEDLGPHGAGFCLKARVLEGGRIAAADRAHLLWTEKAGQGRKRRTGAGAADRGSGVPVSGATGRTGRRKGEARTA